MTALVADADGNVFDLEGYAAVGWRGGIMSVLEEKGHDKNTLWQRSHVPA